MEYYFDPDDKLGRKKYAEFLESMLENCDKYRREDSDGAYVIAIDSPWGTGKTRFAKMLRNYLEGRKPKLSAGKVNQAVIPKPDSKREFNVIYYNSWEVDYWTDAIEPLISNIINSDVFKEFREDEHNKELWNQFKNFAKGVLEASIDVAAEFSIWGKILNILVRGVKKTRERVNKPFEEFDKRKKLYSNFAESLSKIISKTGKKLVIIVDELDRCRPTFAIQTLELAKHLFDVDGLIFAFMLDIKQLSSAVKTVYGQEMDASGYLCRFFDYIGRIPTPYLKEFVEGKLKQIDYYKANQSHFLVHNTVFIIRLAITFSFSLRDIDTIIKSYVVMNKFFLEKYDDYRKHQVYLFLLSLKYKDIDAYDKVFKITPASPKGGVTTSEKYVLSSHADFNDILKTLENNDILRNAFFDMTYYSGTKKSFYAKIISIEANEWESSGKIDIQYRSEPGGGSGRIISIECGEFSWGHVLFYEDLAKWEAIKEMTVSGYLYSQLEMFNFALPADEPITQS